MLLKKFNTLLVLGAITLNPSFSIANEVEDTAITAEVKLKLAAEKDIPAQSIEVETKDRVVNLRGKLDTNLQVNRSIEVASSVDKVEDVVSDKLETKGSNSLISDTVVTAKVKGKIRYLYMYKKIAANYDLHVETTDGTVHIFGTVSNQDDINVIKSAVQTIKGVKSVNVNIK